MAGRPTARGGLRPRVGGGWSTPGVLDDGLGERRDRDRVRPDPGHLRTAPEETIGVSKRYDGRPLANPDALELAVDGQALVLISDRRPTSEQLLEPLVVIEGSLPIHRLEEASAWIRRIGGPAPHERIRLLGDGSIQLRIRR